MEWTEERREKQREIAKDLVAQGKFGGPGRGQGRPRNPRASEKIAELVAKDGVKIYDRLMSILEQGTDSNSILAVRELRAIEENERKIIDQEDQQAIDNLKKDQLLALVVTQLLDLGEKGVIPEDIIDGEIIEYSVERPSELSKTT